MTGSPGGGRGRDEGRGFGGTGGERVDSPGGPPFIGVVLAGGASTRMGRDKAFIEVGGVPMVARVARTMTDAGASRVLVAGGDAPRLSHLGLSVVPDHERGLGPLSGLLAAMDAIADASPPTPEGGEGPLMVSAPCDTPLLSPELISALIGTLTADTDSEVAVTEGPTGLEPLLAAWRVTRCRDTVSERLASGSGAVRGLFGTLDTIVVRWASPVELTNVNTPEDLRALEPRTPPGGSKSIP